MNVEAAIGLGKNIEDRMAHLWNAYTLLLEIPDVKFIVGASIYETEPVDVPQEYTSLTFLNTVLVFDVGITVEQWSQAVHAIEDKMLRTRSNIRNTPRTIDLDLLYFGDAIMDKPHLRLPHPQCTLRRFVCEPLAEIRPHLILPNQTKSIREILETLGNVPFVKKIAPPSWCMEMVF